MSPEFAGSDSDVPSGRLRLVYEQELAGEQVDLIEHYSQYLEQYDVDRFIIGRLRLGAGEKLTRNYKEPGEWRIHLFVDSFPEYWQQDPINNRRKVYSMNREEITAILENKATVDEMYRRTDERIREAGGRVMIANTPWHAQENGEKFATIKSAVQYAERLITLANLASDLQTGAETSQSIEMLEWHINKALEFQAKHSEVIESAVFRDYSSYKTTRGFILTAAARFAGRNRGLVDESVELASRSLNQLRKISRSQIMDSLFAKVTRISNYSDNVEAAVKDDDIEKLKRQLRGSDLFYYKLARKDYPEVFTREYYLSRIRSCAVVPVTPDNIEVFAEFQEMISVIPRKEAGKFIGDSIRLTRGVLEGIIDQYGDEAAVKIVALLDKIITGRGDLSAQTMIALANMLTPNIKLDEKLDPKLRELDTKSLVDLPAALSRIISVALVGVKGQLVKAEDNEDSHEEDVFDYASQCAILMAEVGTSNKLNQHVLTIGDLAIRYPKLSNQDIKKLAENLQQSSQESVHSLYRELKGRSKNSAHFNKWVPGKGLLS